MYIFINYHLNNILETEERLLFFCAVQEFRMVNEVFDFNCHLGFVPYWVLFSCDIGLLWWWNTWRQNSSSCWGKLFRFNTPRPVCV